MNTSPDQPVQHLAKLLLLQRSRVAAAEAEYRTSQAAYNKIKEAMEQRKARIEHMREQLDTLTSYVVEFDAGEIARFSGCAAVRRKWLDHDLERDEYWLEDDQRELSEAETQLEETRRRWLQSRARESGIQNLLNDARTARIREVEARLETEAAESITDSRVML